MIWMPQRKPQPEWTTWLQLRWDGFVVHYGEIGVKGGNRKAWTKVLQQRLQSVLKGFGAKVSNLFDHLFVTVPEENLVEAMESSARVFGVAYVAPVRRVDRSVDACAEVAVQAYRLLATNNSTIAVRVRRVDKSFPLTSQELERQIGHQVVAATGAKVNLTNPDILFTFRVYTDCAYLLGPKISGIGGLPVGVSGRVLCLLSGGIDSAVAAWLVMRRGCLVDFVHFHAFPTAEDALADKVPQLVKALVEPQGLTARLFLIPYYPFQLAVLTQKVPPRLELVLFRRFMVRAASKIAETHGYQALVTGDNIGQVASQTLANLRATEDAASLPILRPLLAWDKSEIVLLAQRIGTYTLSIQPYKDCCSLLARHPETKARLSAVRTAESSLPIEQLVDRTLKEMVAVTVGTEKLEKGVEQSCRKMSPKASL